MFSFVSSLLKVNNNHDVEASVCLGGVRFANGFRIQDPSCVSVSEQKSFDTRPRGRESVAGRRTSGIVVFVLRIYTREQ